MGEHGRIKNDPLYQLLRDGKVEAFNAKKPSGEICCLTGCDFLAVDLRGLDARGVDFADSSFQGSDMRGVDFRQSRLEGASLHQAKIAGAYFPSELAAEEIRLSVEHGIRMRYSRLYLVSDVEVEKERRDE